MNFLFDVDDTLYDIFIPFKNAFLDVFNNLTDIDIYDYFLRSRKYSDKSFELTETKQMSIPDMHAYRVIEAFKELNIIVDKETALRFQNQYDYNVSQISLNDEVKRILDYLKSNKHFIQFITNGPSEHQRKKMNALHLYDYANLKESLVSFEVGFSKPHKEIFLKAINNYHLDLNETYYIGDSYAHDMLGAKEVKMKTIWFNHRHKTRTSDYIPDYEVDNYEDLFTLIQKLTS